MKTLKICFSLLFVLSILNGCGKSENKTSENTSSGQNSGLKSETEQTKNLTEEQAEIIEIKLPTIQCGTCKKNIESAVKKLDGVNEVKVSVKEKTAKVNYNKEKTDLNKIEGAIIMTGYQANEKPANKESYDKLEDCCKIGGHDK